MKRKHNPWVSLVALLLLVTLLVTVCTGCGTTQAEAEEEPGRFTVENVFDTLTVSAYVLTDKETGVQYLYVDGGDGGGLIVLQPAPSEEGGGNDAR